MRPVVILGAGGFAREVLDVFEAANAVKPSWDVRGFLVEAGHGKPGEQINHKSVLGTLDWLDAHGSGVELICGVGAPELRQRLVGDARGRGARFCSIVHPNASMTRWVTLGEGSVVTAGCILTNRIRIGDHAQVNLACTIGHDSTVGDFATLSPGVNVSGRVEIGTGAFVGTGASLIDRVEIGSWSIVGAGAVVTRNVPANTTVVGVPARVIETREDGWHRT